MSAEEEPEVGENISPTMSPIKSIDELTDVWATKMLPQVKEIIVNTVLAAWDKIEWWPGGVGLFGFDLMPDTDYKIWLIEANKCPTMQMNTAVTKELVPMFMHDLIQLLRLDKPPTEEGSNQIKETLQNFQLLYESSKIDEISEKKSDKIVQNNPFFVEGTSNTKN